MYMYVYNRINKKETYKCKIRCCERIKLIITKKHIRIRTMT